MYISGDLYQKPGVFSNLTWMKRAKSLKDSQWAQGVEFWGERVAKDTVDAISETMEEYDPFKNLMEEEEAMTGVRCTTCDFRIISGEREDVVAHYQSPWHKHNARRIIKGREILKEEDFENSQEDADLSALSSSDDEDCMMGSNTGARVYFLQDDTVYSHYRCLLHSGESPNAAVFRRPLNCSIFLMAGGHFCGGVFVGDALVSHKSFHRYVIRAKQGGAQSSHDGSKGAAKSAGAALRRYNERALKEDITNLLGQWAELLAATPLIFIRCASYSQAVFHGKNGFDRKDSRLRSIPFETRRPEIDALKEAWERLSNVAEHGSVDEFEKDLERRKRKQKPLTHKKKTERYTSSALSSDEEDRSKRSVDKKKNHLKATEDVVKEEDMWPLIDGEMRKELYARIRTDDVISLKDLLQKNVNKWAELVRYMSEREFGVLGTFLHIAAQNGSNAILKELLELGCDPGIKNSEGLVPYLVSKNKPTKKVFVDFRENCKETREWSRTHIPVAVKVTAEEAAAAEERKRQKKKRQKEAQQSKKLASKLEEVEKEAQAAWLSMPDRERRALAAEMRLAGEDRPRCVNCAAMLPSVPFTYQNVLLCTPACVAEHRMRNVN